MRPPAPARILLSIGLLITSLGVRAQDDIVIRAMKDEMRRSMQKLQLENLERPYFISYLITDNESQQANANLGSLIYRSESHYRRLVVSVRVGDYTLDNSNFVSGMAVQSFNGAPELPLDDDYDELRRQIWLATDRAYKKALEDFSAKRAALQNLNRPEDIPDFTRAEPVSMTEVSPWVPLDWKTASQLVRAVSAPFRQAPWIQSSRAQLSANYVLERYLNSEGSTFTRSTPRVSLRIFASTQAADGSALSDAIESYAYSFRDLAPESVLASQVRDMQTRLKDLQEAPSEDRYNGPVLFEGQAAAEVFARHFAGLLAAEPSPASNNAQLRTIADSQQSVGLLGRLNARVLPEFMSVVDDPTVTHQGDDVLFGSYKVDEEAVRSSPTAIVEHGILKAVLTSRAPVRGAPKSTGNMRERGVAPSNVFVKSDRSASGAELIKRLVESSKTRGNDYGIVIRRLSGDLATLAYRVYGDGREELIRNVRIQGLDERSFKDITDVSVRPIVYTEVAPLRRVQPFVSVVPSGSEPLVSYVVPSLLFDDATIVKSTERTPRLPIASNPLLDSH